MSEKTNFSKNTRPVSLDANPFQPAGAVQRPLKVLVYGVSGTGKTYFGLNSPRPCAMIDLEGGSAHYGKHPQIGGFDRISTKDLAQIEAAIRYARSGAYETLVIDPVTVIWNLLQDAALVIARKRKRAPADDLEVGLAVKDWGAIKRKYSSLMTELVNLPCHVVLIAREKDITKQGNDGQMEVIGQKGDAEKSTDYYPDIVIRLTVRGRKRFATIIKDRTSTFQVGQEVEDPALSLWLSQARQDGHIEPLERDDEVDAANASTLEDPSPSKPDPTKHNGEDWKSARARLAVVAKEHRVSAEDVKALMMEEYGVDSSVHLDSSQLRNLARKIEEMTWATSIAEAEVSEEALEREAEQSAVQG